MKWTAEKILEEYNRDPSKKNMGRIAAENECSLKEIGEFLKTAANKSQKKKPGRPKKNPEESKKPSIEVTKKDTAPKMEIKSTSQEGKMRNQKYLIPDVVVSLTKDHIDRLTREIEFFENAVMEKKLKKGELEDFLNGGFCYGEEDGVHGKV